MASILKVDTIQDQDGNNIINESGDTITIGASGDTITVPSGATFSAPGIANTPAFKATASANQSIANNTSTKIEFDTEDFDTDNAYDTTNDKFTVPSGKAGKYFFNTAIRIANLGDGDVVDLRFHVNGIEVTENRQRQTAGTAVNVILQCSMIKALSVGDYVEVFASHDYGSNRDTTNTYLSFQGYKLVE